MTDLQIVAQAQIDDEFEGFDEDRLFKLTDGTYWIQDEYKYWYHYAYMPKIQLLRGRGRTYLQLEGQSQFVSVRQITQVIESRISDEFRGWEGESAYQLENGQVWQQSRYKYEYKYAYRPDVIIYNPGGGHVMQVAGTSAIVQRLK